ncbi:MAG: radical SAM protein [Lachnospiraceae bacterium]|nr:radical SAM protein [Lachnospiraceae bacterium]
MGRNSGLGNYIKKQHMRELAEYRDETLRPCAELRSLFLELTVLCNEHCRHCGSQCGDVYNEKPLTLEEYKKILDDVKRDFDISKMRLCVTGGEPLLYPDFFELMNYANKLGYSWGMTSNGTLITEDVAKRLKESGMSTISVSVDGLKDTHDWFRESVGSYERTMQGIQNLLKFGNFKHVQITTVVHHRNYGELEEMYELFSKTGVRSWRVINIEPIGRAKENPELMLTKEEYRGLIDFIEKHRFSGNMEVSYGCSHYLGVKHEREVRKWYFLCNAGVYVASIMNNGNITACLDIERRPELIQGNIRVDRLKDVWENKFEIFRTDFRKAGKCAKCKQYPFCAGDSFHTWNFDTMEPNICMYEMLKH